MRLTRFTDYALRVLLYLAERPGRHCPISEIAAAHGISANHLAKVVHGLGKAGYVAARRGCSGGRARRCRSRAGSSRPCRTPRRVATPCR